MKMRKPEPGIPPGLPANKTNILNIFALGSPEVAGEHQDPLLVADGPQGGDGHVDPDPGAAPRLIARPELIVIGRADQQLVQHPADPQHGLALCIIWGIEN